MEIIKNVAGYLFVGTLMALGAVNCAGEYVCLGGPTSQTGAICRAVVCFNHPIKCLISNNR